MSRDTAAKPIDHKRADGNFVLSCPECKEPIVNVWSRAKYEPNYCHYCGQKLKWGEKI